MSTKEIVELVFNELSPIVEEKGAELVEVTYKRERTGMNLTLFIDARGGINIEDCERVHKAVDVVLDELDPTNGAPYTLNVSSLGLDRPLKTAKDFERNYGELIDISLYSKLNGKKEYTGKLIVADEENLELEVDGVNLTLPRQSISKVTKHISF